MNGDMYETKKNFKEAFFRLFEQGGFSGITVKKLCETAGYNRSTFYLYYQDIFELLRDIDNELLSPLWMHMCKSFRAGICLNQLPSETLSYFGKNNEHFRLLMQQDEKFIQKCKDMLLTEFDKEGYTLKDHYRNELVIAAFIRLLIFWYENNCDLPLEELLSLFRELDDYLLEHRGQDLK